MHVVIYEGLTVREEKKPDLPELLTQEGIVIWIDMTGPMTEDTRALREVFRFHPLAIEQVLDHKQRPKVEEYSDHLFAIMNSAHVDGVDVYFRELDIFVKRNLLVTVHRFPEPAINTARRMANEACATKGMTSGYLLYTLLQVVVDSYFPVLDKLERILDRLEDEIIDRPTQDKLTRLFALKRTVAEIWRIAAQQRDMFSVLMREDSPYINHVTLRYYLRDTYDHLLRVYDSANAIRDNVSNVVDLFFSSQSQQLNLYINRLTLITIAIGILAVITGFYGMNFERTIPFDFDSPWGIPFVLLLIVLVLTALYFILRRQGRS